MLLLGLFSLALIAPALPTDPESNLPSCCRRDGKHACGMMERKTPAGPAWQSAKCPSFPTIKGLPTAPTVAAAPEAGNGTVRVLDSEPAAGPEAASPRQSSQDRSCRKRGPPSLA